MNLEFDHWVKSLEARRSVGGAVRDELGAKSGAAAAPEPPEGVLVES